MRTPSPQLDLDSIFSDVFSGPGYSVVNLFTASELLFIRKLIESNFLSILKPHLDLESFESISIDKYHLFSDQVDHSTLWTKSNRILVPEDLFQLLNLPTLKYILDCLSCCSITDEDNLGYSNIYWRLVRPFQPTDIGPLHRDSWFWTLNSDHRMPLLTNTRIKLWFPIIADPGKNGLKVVPYSHTNSNILWEGVERDGIIKPNLLTPVADLSPILLPLSPGQAVFFHDDLLHGGALNQSTDSTRVSAEATIAFSS